MIYLFNKDKELINIIGEDEVQSALYDREINNVYQLDVDLPLYFWDKDVKVNLREIFNDVEFIGHYDLNEKFQLHKIAQFDILDEVIAVKGVHFFFDEAKAKHIIRDRRFANATAQAGAQAIADQLGWRLVYQATDTITSNYNFYNISPLEALNIIIDRFNIEIDFSFDFNGIRILNKELIVKSKLGEVKDTTFYYSKEFHAGYNALSVKYEQDYSEIYTAVIPRGKGEEVGDGYGRRLEIDEVVWSKPNDPLDKPLGEEMLIDPVATQRFGYAEEGVIKPRVKVVNFNETEDGEILIQQGYEWLSENNRPKIVLSTTVDDSEEVNFGDTIWVIYEEIDLKEQFRVARVIDNLITGDRQIEIGDLDYFRSSLSEQSTNNRISDLESQTEQLPDVIKYVVSANGYNRSFWGSIEPQNVIEGDVWFKPDETSDGDTIMLVWDGERWVETARTKDDGRIRDLLDKYEELADEIGEDIELTVDQIIDVLDGANQVDLAHLFARLIGDDRFSTLFYQEAENVGFVYREGDEVKSIIAIQSGVPFIRGEHIILDGNTIVDGDFTVTEQMLADSAVFDKLETHGIDAAEIRVINLDASNISGGNLELANGLKITNNGAVVMSVTADGKFIFDATAAGVATKDELEDIELTPGPEGPQGPAGYTPIKGTDYFDGVDGQDGKDGDNSYLWVMYSHNASGSVMVDDPTNAKYIGVATTTSPTRPSTPSSYKWSLIKGEDGVKGEEGSDGKTSYLHIKYSNDDGQTFTANNGETVGYWIGTYVDFTEADSNNVSDYTWNKVKGEKGDTGDTGPRGLRGLEGPQGDQGIEGPKGDDGKSSYTHIAYATGSSGGNFSTSHFSGATYIGMYVSDQPDDSSDWRDYNWSLIKGADGSQGIEGPKGDDGRTPYFHTAWANNSTGTSGFSTTVSANKLYIGTVTTFESDDPTEPSVYNWTKIKGEKGDKGDVGPRGLTGLEGPKGDQGIEGPKGEDGESSYTHIAYATGSTGQNFSTSHFSSATYIGMYVSNSSTDSTDYRDYKWSLIKGANGARGIEGPKGDDGLTPYFHTAWANNSTGSSGFSTTVSANKLYIGTVTTFEPDDPTTPSVYSWTKIKGEQGEKGDTGERGATGAIGPRGATGTSVSSVTEYYLASSASSGVTTGTSGWSTSMKTMTATLKYLWNYEKINFSDGTSQDTIPVVIGVYGDKGGTGATGRSITGITEHYLASSSKTGVTRSTSGWSTTMQTTTPTKQYLWNYETITWSSGTSPTYVDPIIIGVHGAKGDKGATGDKGAKGDQGIQGPKGLDGQSQYVHIRYSANSSGSGNVANPTTSTKYIGIAITNTSTRPTANSAYTWSKYQGDDGGIGPQGIQGPKGDNGQPTYTWVKYADTPTTGMNNFPDGKKYIGLAFNKSTATESNSYNQYAWSLMPQNIALGVRNLIPWTNFTDFRDNISKWTTWGSASIWRASQIGKYMLFRNGNTDRTGSTTIGVISPPFYKNVEAGKTYTVRFLANTITPYTPFAYSYLMNVDGVQKVGGTGTGNQGLPAPTVIEEYERFTASGYANLYEITFSPTWNGPAALMLASTIDASALSSHYISEVMLIEGDTISRDWQPAPEDVEQLMHNNIDGKIDDVNAELSEHWEAIGDKVSTTAFTDALNSLKSDYEAGLIEASKVPAEVTNLLARNEKMISRLGDKVATWEFLDTHIKMGNEGLYIGEIEGDSKLLIGTDRISFMQGENEIAYISGQQMYINRSINLESIQVGSHVQMKINNNLTVIQWAGG